MSSRTKYNAILRNGRRDILERVFQKLRECYADEGEFDVLIKHHVEKMRQSQRGYYRAVVLPAIANHEDSGHTGEEIHELMLLKFAPRKYVTDLDGNEQELIITTADNGMNKEQMTQYLSEVIRWAEECGVRVPPPRRPEDIWEEMEAA